MNIAICDDDRDELMGITSILDEYKNEHKTVISYDSFYSAMELLANAQQGKYQIYILDVLMPGVNGMEAAREIRTFDKDAIIVFLTSSTEFAVESYKYKAQDYLLKPAKKADIFALIDAVEAKDRNPEDYFALKKKNGIIRVKFKDVVYVEAMGRYLYFNMSDKSVTEVVASFAEYQGVLLSRPELVRTHRSYIVNLIHVSEFIGQELKTFDGIRIPVSRKNISQVKEAYVEQFFSVRRDL